MVTSVLQAGGAETVTVLAVLAVVLLGLAAVLVVWLGLTVWTYRDAKRRGVDSPVLWATIVSFVGPPGVVLYLLVRE